MIKKSILFAVCLICAGCAGTAFDAEHRKNAVMNIFERNCPSEEYVLVADNPNNKNGWKSQREFACKQGEVAQKVPSLDGKTYTKAQMKEKALTDKNVHNLF